MAGSPFFTGIRGIIRGRMTYNAHGVVPSKATIVFPPQNVPVQFGTLTFADETGRSVHFNNCLIDSIAVHGGGTTGTVLQATILDERWTWANKQVRGAYNIRKPNGDIREETKRTPQQLASILMQAIGIRNFEVGGLPNLGNPEVVWDYSNAAQELNRLAESYGCRVVRELNGRVVIRRLGVGANLPNYPNMQPSFGFDPVNKPGLLRVICGPSEWQREYELEAVAEEQPGGKYVPLEDVSYKPADGWETEDPEYFYSIEEPDPPPEDKTTDRQLALRSAFRAYRIKSDNDWPDVGEGVELKFEHILPISSTILETAEDPRTGQRVRKPPRVRGAHFDGRMTLENTDEKAQVNISFSLVPEQGVILFSEPVYTLDGTEFAPAKLWLTCSHRITDPAYGVPFRQTFFKPVSGAHPDAGVKVLPHDEINLQTITNASGTETNKEDIRTQAEYYVDSELASYSPVVGQTLVTAGIIGMIPDGAISQFQWSCGSNEPTVTTICRNSEMDYFVPKYEDRQRAIEDRKAQQQLIIDKRKEALGIK